MHLYVGMTMAAVLVSYLMVNSMRLVGQLHLIVYEENFIVLKSATVRCCYLEHGPFFVHCGFLFPIFTFIYASSWSSPSKTYERKVRVTITIICGQQKPGFIAHKTVSLKPSWALLLLIHTITLLIFQEYHVCCANL